MKRFIVKTILVAFSWLLPLYILQAIYDHTAYHVYDRWPYNKINTAFDKPQNADLIVMGNSRAYGNYIPEILDSVMNLKSCNLGFSGYSFLFNDKMVLEPYLKHNTPPRIIIQDVGPFAFFEDINPPYRIEFLPYINREEFSFYIDKCPELSVFDKYLPLKYHGQLSVCWDNFWSFVKEEGDQPERKYYMKDYFWGEDFRQLEKDPAILDLFVQYVRMCKANHIKLFFVCSPTHTVDGFAHFDMKGFRKMVNDIAKNEGIPFLDYSEIYGADTLYFIDPVHLKMHARKDFSKRVASDVMKRL